MKGLLIIEHDNKQLKPVNYHTLKAMQELSLNIDVLVIGYECEEVAKACKKLPGIHKILLADARDYAHQLAENVAKLIADVGKNYDYVCMAATTFGKNLLPRSAALLDVGIIADVVQVVSPDTFIRPMYAGNALATIQSLDKIKLLTIRATGFGPVQQSKEEAGQIERIENTISNPISIFIDQALTASARPELTASKIIISGGRGLKSADNFKLLEGIADRLGAAIGASRAAVDAGYAPNDYQVGQTGKIVAPDLYIAVGISGAIQHLAGMKDSKVIVAINSDPDAPIFEIADYAWVTDLFPALKELQVELDK